MEADVRTRKWRRFLQWMRKNGIVYSDALSLGQDQVVSGNGVKALCDLKEGELIATIPKKTCLTVLTTGASEALDAAQLGGGLGLAVAVMYERSRGKKSPWFRYLDVLPNVEMVPFVWSEEEIDSLLTGTELHKVIKQDKQFIKEDWEENIVSLTKENPKAFPEEYFTLDCYFAAKSLVASRSFEVDDYHGPGMVPLADLFNHKTAAEDVHIMTNSSDTDEAVSDESENELDSQAGGTSDVLEMALIKDVKQGAEIFNTYGQLSNAALLHKYGFTEPNNPYDIVNIDMDCVLKVLPAHLKKKQVLNAWRRAGFAGCESQNFEYFEINADGKPEVELLLLLFLMDSGAKAYKRLADVKVMGNVRKAAKLLGWHKDRALEKKKKKKKKQKLDSSVTRFNSVEEWFLTPSVAETLLRLIAQRDEEYEGLLEYDKQKLGECQGFKAFHALSLRIAERNILQRCKHAVLELQSCRI